MSEWIGIPPTDEELAEWVDEHIRAPWTSTPRKHPQLIYGDRLLSLLNQLIALRAKRVKLDDLEQARKERELCPDCKTIHDQLYKRLAEVETQLEQAQKTRNEVWAALRVRDEEINLTVKKRTAERNAVQQFAKDAHALLMETTIFLRRNADCFFYEGEATGLRARIEDFLEPKP